MELECVNDKGEEIEVGRVPSDHYADIWKLWEKKGKEGG